MVGALPGKIKENSGAEARKCIESTLLPDQMFQVVFRLPNGLGMSIEPLPNIRIGYGLRHGFHLIIEERNSHNFRVGILHLYHNFTRWSSVCNEPDLA